MLLRVTARRVPDVQGARACLAFGEEDEAHLGFCGYWRCDEELGMGAERLDCGGCRYEWVMLTTNAWSWCCG
jgi:hypothetical protein